MSYTIYLGALASLVVAAVGGGAFVVLPVFGIYRLSTKLEGKCKWFVLALGDLCVMFGGGYIYMTFFCRFMDYLYATVYSIVS